MLCQRLTTLQASTSAGPSGVRHLFVKPAVVVPSPYPERATRVDGIRSPQSRAARLPRPQIVKPGVRLPYDLKPMQMNRPHLVDSFAALPVAGNRIPDAHLRTPGNTNKPTGSSYTPGSHEFRLPRPVSSAVDSITGASYVHTSPPLIKIDHRWLPKPARAKKILVHGVPEEGENVPVLHHRTTEHWNEDLAFAVRRRDEPAAIAFVQEMRNNGVRCDETTLRLLVEVTDIADHLRDEIPQELIEERGRPATKVLLEIEEAVKEEDVAAAAAAATSAENALTASGVPQWKASLQAVADASRRITSLQDTLRRLDVSDSTLADQIRALPPLTPQIASLTKAIMATAPVRSREHAKTLYHSRTFELETQLAELRRDELGPIPADWDPAQTRRTAEQFDELEKQHRDYNTQIWYTEYEQGRQTEIAISHKVDSEVIQPRKKALNAFAAESLRCLAGIRDAKKSLKDAEELVRKEGEVSLPARWMGGSRTGVVKGEQRLIKAMEVVYIEVKTAMEEGKDPLTGPSGANSSLTPQEVTLARKLIHRALLSSAAASPKTTTATSSSSSPSSSDSSNPSSTTSPTSPSSPLALASRNLDQTLHLLSHFSSLSTLTHTPLTLSHWAHLIGRYTSYRSSLTSSTAPESWSLAFSTAYDLFVCRAHAQPQSPDLALAAAVLETLSNAVQTRPDHPQAVSVTLEVLERMLVTDGGSGLHATEKGVESPHEHFQQAMDFRPLPSLAKRNAPIYALLNSARTALKTATTTRLESEEIERVREMIGREGAFAFDPVWEEGTKAEVVIEGAKMRGLVGEVEGLLRNLGRRARGEKEEEIVMKKVEAKASELLMLEGGVKTDGENVLSFAEGR